eukprot:scaffold2437_cov395-Prasinococcus_capsulatus_cf.AAC.15
MAGSRTSTGPRGMSDHYRPSGMEASDASVSELRSHSRFPYSAIDGRMNHWEFPGGARLAVYFAVVSRRWRCVLMESSHSCALKGWDEGQSLHPIRQSPTFSTTHGESGAIVLAFGGCCECLTLSIYQLPAWSTPLYAHTARKSLRLLGAEVLHCAVP